VFVAGLSKVSRGDFRRRLINGKFPRYCIDARCALKDVLHD
jgi:hypothetical protein